MSFKGFIWDGFQFKWKNNPHRLSRLGSRIVETEGETQHHFTGRIGNWPEDIAQFECPWRKLESTELIGFTNNYTVQIESVYNRGARLKGSFKLDIGGVLGLGGEGKLTNFNFIISLNGFQIEPLNNPSGWHFGGLGIRLGKVKPTENGLYEVDYEVFASPGSTEEPMPHGNGSWKNPEKPLCKYEITFDYLILGLPVSFQEAALYYKSTTVKRRGTTHQNLEFAHQKTSNNNIVLPLLTGFQIEMDPEKRKRKYRARYMRALGVNLAEINADSGTWKAIASFSNKGKLTYGWTIKMQAWTMALEIPPKQLKIKQGALKGQVSSKIQESISPLNT